HLADREGLPHPCPLSLEDGPLEDLDPLTGALDHPHVDLYGVPGPEVGNVVPQAVAVDDVGRVHWARLSTNRSDSPPSGTFPPDPSRSFVSSGSSGRSGPALRVPVNRRLRGSPMVAVFAQQAHLAVVHQ